jgi:hypothetical protein
MRNFRSCISVLPSRSWLRLTGGSAIVNVSGVVIGGALAKVARAASPEDVAREAQQALRAFGVQVCTSVRVIDVTEAGVKVPDEFIPACTV